MSSIERTNRKTRNFVWKVIEMAEKEGLSEEQFAIAVDTAKKVIRRSPVASKCRENIKLEPNELFDEIEITELNPEY